MKCERCGAENDGENYFCRQCWAELEKSDDDESSFDISKYKKASSYQRTYSNSSNVYDGNNKYINGLYNTDNNNYTSNNYADNNRRYSAQNNTRYNNYNTQYNSNGDYKYPTEKSTYNYYTEESLPAYKTNVYRNSSNNSNNSNNTVCCTDEERQRIGRSVDMFIVLSMVVPVAILLIIGSLIAVEDVGVNLSGENSQTIEDTVQATQPTIPKAELGYSQHTITDFDGENIKATYHPPKGYDFVDYGMDSYAVFESDIYGKVVSLKTMFFSGDIQEEIDYYKSLEERNGTTVEIDVTDIELGETTLIKVATNGKGINYQIYAKADDEYYFYISMTNVPFEYSDEAEKLIEMLVNDTEISYVKEDKAEKTTE